MIIYRFPGIEDLDAYSGYQKIEIRGGRLELEFPPTAELAALIKRSGGVLAVDRPATKTKDAPKAKKEAKDANNAGGKD